MSYATGGHTVFHHRYHIVRITKYRYKVLEGAFRDRIRTIIPPSGSSKTTRSNFRPCPPPAACRDQAAGHNGGAETLTDRGACEACPRGNGVGHLAPADRAQREDSRLRRFEYSEGGLVLEQ